MKRFLRFLLLVVCLLPVLSAGAGSGRYALILSDPPAASRFTATKNSPNNTAQDYRRQIQAAQAALRRQLESRGIPYTGAVQSVLNAVFVRAPESRLEELRRLPGVKGVVPVGRRFHLELNSAVPLVNGPAAWTILGGAGNAGAGVKIAVIDTGIDQTHPAFQDESLSVPSGFPKCEPEDCAFTNRKVIVARSYVRQLGAGTPPNPAVDSRPDDTSPRDRVGHGTAVAMTAAGGTNAGPAATITGVAPQAWLGNYKVFGSPGVNDGTSGDVIILAVEDALNDGMDVAVLSLGISPLFGALDEGAICGQSPGVPCDPVAAALENAIQGGLAAVVAAGNEGDTGSQTPSRGTISSPATAPSAIAAGASTNSHIITSSVSVPGSDVPGNLRKIPALLGDGQPPPEPLTAPLRDVSALGDDGLACSGLPGGSLTGAMALIQRGTCFFFEKAAAARDAGAVAVVFYLADGDETLIYPGGLSGAGIPAVMIGNTNGRSLKTFLQSHPDAPVTLDPALSTSIDVSSFDKMAGFSSRGPSIGDLAIKPELVAVGTNLYVAAQRFDPNGILYDPSGYTVTQGTSFSAPMVAGAVALVKQKDPGLTPAQLKSAVVNSAAQVVTENGGPAPVTSAGAGRLDAALAVRTTVTVEPAAVSFGALLEGAFPASRQLVIRNSGSSPAMLSLSVSGGAPGTQLTLDSDSLSLAPGEAGTITATLSGSLPSPGMYNGSITIQGGGAALRAPYMYLVGDGVPFDIIPLEGSGFVGVLGDAVDLAFKLEDQFGVPIQGSPVHFSVAAGGGSIQRADAETNVYGIAQATAKLGTAIGLNRFTAEAGGRSFQFSGSARLRPTINPNGVVNAASFEAGPGAAPGSYISIFGMALGSFIEPTPAASLPLSLAGVSVSFDVPPANLSLPGRLQVAAPGQVNVQVPWELSGQSSVLVKVSIGDISTELYELPLADVSPGVFEILDRESGQRFAAALDEDNQVIDSGNPARPGRPIQLFLNGLGAADSRLTTGEPTPLPPPLVRTVATPAVTIAGRSATLEFGGLTPSVTGLYQVNAVVPPDTPSGIQPLVVTISGVTAKTVSLPVR